MSVRRRAPAASGGRPRAPALKRFSQNFLIDENVAREIVDASEVGEGDSVLEIGPGRGALTELLAERVGRLRAVEVDRALACELATRFQDRPHVEVWCADALILGLDALLPPGETWSIVANLPYRITSPLLFAILDVRERLRSVTVMIQREVALRIQADCDTREWGTLSVHVQRVADARVLFEVPPTAFRPRPAVHSAVLRIDFLARPRVAVPDEQLFRRVVKAALGHRRKTLRNALGAAGLSSQQIDDAARALGLDMVRRGETLDLDELAALTRWFTTLEVNPSPVAESPALSTIR